MFTFLNKVLEKKIKLIVFFSFVLYFITGLFIFKDYGIAFDEDIQRSIGLSNYNFIKNFFQGIKSEINFPSYGIGFEIPLILFEKLFQIKNIENIYLLRHLIIFITSFVGQVFFFFLLKKIFNSEKIALLGLLIFILSPRIFAESFYNSKDIIFMYSFIICTYFAIIFLENSNFKNAIIFGTLIAWSSNIRLAALFILIIVYYFYIIKILRKDNQSNAYFLSLNFFITLFFLVIFWPSLWSNPINNLFISITSFANYDLNISNLFLGEYIFAKSPPWFYIPTWIFITVPFYILFFFSIGFFKILKRIYKRLININDDKPLNDLWRGKKELRNLIFFSIIFISILIPVVLQSTLYNGWRHFYFLYPFIIIISLTEIKFYFTKYKNLRTLFIFILLFCILFHFKLIINSHPHQYSYFNFLAGKNPHKNFEVDYWGLSNKYALEKILKEENNSKKITVSNFSDTSLIQNLSFLNIKNKNFFIYIDKSENPDFLIDNNYFFNLGRKKINILNNYNVFDKLIVDGTLVTTIYKKK